MFINYAHRGASAYAPENTMIAFKKAIELGATGIELDLQKTKDGKIVIFHDDFIDKKSNGTGKIEDYTYEQLLELDFGSWFEEKYRGEKIVLFEDFAKEFLNRDLTFAIELKVNGIEKETLDIVDKYVTHDNIYITSFMYEILENVRKIDNNIKISWLIDEEIKEANIQKLLKIKGNQICPKVSLVTEQSIALAKQYGIGVRLWKVSNEDVMKEVYKLDIEGMTVNFPDKLNELLKKLTSQKALELLNNSKGLAEDDNWIEHSICVGNTAGKIAEALKLDKDFAKTLGYIHDIGRRFGNHTKDNPHDIKGYEYIKELGYGDNYASVCLTHSYLNNDINCVAGGMLDLSGYKYDFRKEFIEKHEYTIYEKIVNLCDLICKKEVMTLEKRLEGLVAKYGVYENTDYHIREAQKLKQEFDELLGYNVCDLFSNITKN